MENQPSSIKIGLNYGLVTGLVMVIYSLIQNMTGLYFNTFVGVLSYLFLIIGIIWAHRSYKQNGDSYLSYSKGLGLGTLVGAFAGICVGIFTFIYTSFIDTGFIDTIKNQQIMEFENQGISGDQLDMSISIMDTMMTPFWMGIFGILGLTFFAFLFSLVISAFTKNPNPETEI